MCHHHTAVFIIFNMIFFFIFSRLASQKCVRKLWLQVVTQTDLNNSNYKNKTKQKPKPKKPSPTGSYNSISRDRETMGAILASRMEITIYWVSLFNSYKITATSTRASFRSCGERSRLCMTLSQGWRGSCHNPLSVLFLKLLWSEL